MHQDKPIISPENPIPDDEGRDPEGTFRVRLPCRFGKLPIHSR